VTFNSSF